jgi:hypothetical protein
MRFLQCGSRRRPSFIGAVTHSCRTFHSHPAARATAATIPGPATSCHKSRPACSSTTTLPLHCRTAATFYSTATLPTTNSVLCNPATTKTTTTTRQATAATAIRCCTTTTPRRALSTSRAMDTGKWTGVAVRQTFFDYFEKRGHTIGTKTQEYSGSRTRQAHTPTARTTTSHPSTSP